jgi:hypothetical protein
MYKMIRALSLSHLVPPPPIPTPFRPHLPQQINSMIFVLLLHMLYTILLNGMGMTPGRLPAFALKMLFGPNAAAAAMAQQQQQQQQRRQ